MGVEIKVSEISKLIIYYSLIITCCDISLVNCDIHKMRQLQESDSDTNRFDFKINATELEEHIMSGLNITKKPDIDLVRIDYIMELL